MTTYNAQSIVFIDSRVPNLQELLDGLQPDEQAFVLDASSDGVEQIANILAANNITDLSSISVVGHGETGEMELGSSTITDANLASHSNALAEIGASLAPGGDIKLYGCDVALGTTGQQFINDFSTLAGGAPVEASTQLVGSVSLGASWTLNAVSGSTTPTTDASAPFTSAALANFSGVLQAAGTQTEIWFVTAGGGNGNTIDFTDNTGNNTASSAHTQFQGNTNLTHPTDIALDTQDNLYFMVDSDGSHDRILKATLSQAVAGTAGLSFTTLYSEPKTGTNTFGDITALAIDVPDQIVYFSQNNNDGISESLVKVKFDGTGLTTLATISTPPLFFNDMALDLTTGNAYLTAFSRSVGFGGTTVGANYIYDVSGLSAASTHASFTQVAISPADANLHGNNFPVSLGILTGISVDQVNHVLYFTTQPDKTTDHGGIYSYNLTANPSHTFLTVWAQPAPTALTTGAGTPFGELNYIQVDPQTNTYYVSDFGKFTSVGVSDNSVYVGSMTGTSLQRTPSHFLSVNGSPSSASPEGIAEDNVPTLTITPVVAATFTESSLNPAASNHPTVGLISSATATDSDNTKLAGAAVSIGGFFAGDTLTFSTTGTSISASYNSSSGLLTLTGVDSFADYQTVLASVDFTSTSDNPTNFGSDTSRALTWVVNDGLLTSAPQTSTVTVVGVNDPPSLTPASNSANYTEEQSPFATLFSSLSIVDVDDLNLSSATVKIAGGSFAGDTDFLAASVSSPGITVSYNTSTQTLTLTGTDTLAHYQAVLDGVTFNSGENPTNYTSNPTRTITWQVMDPSGTALGGVATSALATTTLTITNVNDPPTLSNTVGTVNFTEGTAITLSPAATVSDPDNLNLAGATVTIGGGTFAGDGDTLGFSTTGTAIGASYNSTTETLVLSGSDTKANYAKVLDSITFNSGSNPDDYGSKPTRTVTWVVNDGGGSSNTSLPVTTTVSITAINDPPVLSNVATSATYTENHAGLTLSSALTVSDVDSLNIANATISIGGGFAGDVMSVDGIANGTTVVLAAGHTVTVSYNSSTEVLTLTGADTLAHYQTLLEEVNFSSTSHNPDNYGSNPTRTVTWVVNDGSGSNNLSSVATTTLSIVAVNDPPTLSGTATSVAFTENGPSVVLSPSVTVTDPDNLTLASATVQISGSFPGDGDLLSANVTGTNITANYNSTTETLTLTGADTPANYQTVLDTITFTTPSDNPTNFGSNPTRTVNWVLDDGSATNTPAANETISITAINDPPTLANVASSVQYTELNPAAVLSSSAAVTDPDNQKLVSATVQIGGGTFAGDGDVLSIASATTTGTNITASYNAGTETLTLTGTDTLARYQTVLDSVAFSSTSHNPDQFGSNPTRTVTWVLNDGSATNTPAANETISITAINDAPSLAIGTTIAAWTEEQALPTSLAPTVTVSDVDNQNLTSATVKITGGIFGGDADVLATDATGTSITASYDSSSETLFLTGSDTLANYQTVLDRITFHAGENPTNFGSDLTRVITWQVNDGGGTANGGVQVSSLLTTTVSITNVNDPPTLSNVAASLTVTPAVATTVSPTLAVSDPDNLALVGATVKITGGTFPGDGDVLGFDTGGTSVTATYDTSTETLTLSGSASLTDYQKVLDTVTFETTAADPTDGGLHPTRTLTWVADDGSGSSNTSVPATTTITIQNGPAISPPASVNYTEHGGPVALAPTVTVSDSDGSTSLISATVAITGGTFAGDADVLGFDTSGTSVAATYDAANERLILTGSASLADYNAVLDSVTFVANENPTDFGSHPTRTVTWTVQDDSGTPHDTGTATSTINITNVNDAPTLALGNTVATWTEEQSPLETTLAPTAAVTDADNVNLSSATVQITGGTFTGDADFLAASVGGTNITESYNSSTETLLLTGTDSLTNYQTVLNSVTFHAGENPTDFGSSATRTLTWTLNDGSGSFATSAATLSTISIINVNDPPVLSNVAPTVGFELSQTITVSPATSVTDPDSLTLVGATVSITDPGITNGTFNVGGGLTGDVLAVDVSGTGIAFSYDTTTETLTLTGTDTLAHYQTVLDRVTFSSGADPSDGGSDATRTVTWVVDDGGGSSNTSSAQTTINVHVGPGIFVPASASYTEEPGTPTTLAPAVSLNDTSGTTFLTSATVALTGGTFTGDADLLTLGGVSNGNTGAHISFSYDSTSETLTLTGSDTFANYQNALDQVAFSAAENPTDFGSHPTRTVTWTVVDNQSSFSTGTATSTISITNINDAPTLALGNTVTTWTEEQAPLSTTLAPAAVVTDPDNVNLASATVQITGGTFGGDADVLAADTTGTSITASYNAATETLTLTGTDSLGNYQTVLNRITFHAGENPTDFGSNPTRTLTWTLNDGAGSFSTSAATVSTISITNVNDPPTISNVAPSDSFTVGTTITLSPSVSLTDPDNVALTGATVKINGGFGGDGDLLQIGGLSNGNAGANISFSYTAATETLTLTGSDSLTDYQTVLDSITFSSGIDPNHGNINPNRTVTWVVNDGGASNSLSNTATTTINIAHEPPVLVSVAPTLDFTQGNTTAISPSITVTDFDSTSLVSATVQVTGGFPTDGDVLSFNTTGTSVTASYNSSTETLTLTGSAALADYKSVLDSVKFSSGLDPTNQGNNQTRTVTWVVNDGNGSLGQSTSQTTNISVHPIDNPPTLSNVAPSANFTENGPSVTLSSTLSVSDPDVGSTIKSATVSIVGGTFGGDGDVLSATTTGNIVATYDSASETLTLTGQDTAANYKTVLDSVTFIANGDNPTDYGSDPTRTITWIVKDNLQIPSAPATTTVSITAINDPPTLSVASSVSFLEGSTIQLSPTATVTDPDSLNIVNATVHINGGFLSDGDLLLANVAGTHITQSYSSSTETLSLTGSDPLATYQAVLDSITFSSGSNPTNYGSNPNRVVTWVANDGSGSNNLSTVVNETVNITPINDPPALSGLADSQYTEEQGSGTTLSGSATVSDPDSLNLVGATVAITGGTFTGDSDVLAFNTTGTSVAASYDSTTETLTLSGTASLADYQHVLDSITFQAGENPTNYGSDAFRTITWLLNDGSLSNNLSTVKTTTVTVTNINDPPTLSNIPATVSYTEEGAATITLAPTAALSDADNLTFANATVAITGGTFLGDGDVLSADTTGTAITTSYDSTTETLTLNGSDTTANYAKVLESITFTTRLENPNNFGSDPTRTIVWTVNDGAGSNNFGTTTTTVSITNINDAPTLSNVTSSASFTEEGGAVTLAGAASVSDPDNLKLANATVKITGGGFTGDVLATNVSGTNVTFSYDSASETLALTGTDTLANYQFVLDHVTFNAGENPTNFGSNPTRTVVWTLNDGSGSFNSSTVTSTISVTNVNDAPTLTNVPASASFTEEGGAVTLASGASIVDLDDLNLSSATVQITGGTFANDGDVLSANTAGTGISVGYNSTTETLTLSGTDTLAHYRSVLDSVTFNAGENPTNFGSNATRTLTWTLMDPSGTANGGANVSAPVNSTVSITNVNDPPTLSNVAASVAVTLVGQTIAISPSVSVSDPDNLKLAGATVAITAGAFAGDGDVLAANTSGTAISASYNAATETLALSGTDTLAHYQAVLDSVTFNTTNPNPTNSGVDRTRTVTWTLNDGSGSNNLSSPAFTTISFQNVPPFDLNGDLNSDLVFQLQGFNSGSNTGTPGIWLMNGPTPLSQVGLPNPGASWHVVGSRDLNGDGKADLIWQDNNGTPGIWLMNGTTPISEVGLSNPGANWHIVGSGDTNGDGKGDIIWQESGGTLGVWEMNGTTPIAEAGLNNPGPTWKVVGAADFNNDGRDDILLQNTTNGNLMVDLMNGTSITSSVTISVGDPSWHAVSTGVFNGVAEIAWQNTNGTPGVWLMNGTTPSAEVGLPNPGSGWQLVSMDHFTQNGQADLLFQNNTNDQMQLWEMNGTNLVAQVALPNPGAGWILQNGHPFASG